MLSKLKKVLYFPVASYFRFFAEIRMKKWNPKIIVVTGSNGKTTLLHLLESQIGEKAKYSHHANSSFGIPFDILDLHRRSLLKSEWIGLIIKTPFAAFKSYPRERIYIVETDCDRPGEGHFLGSLLKPDIVIWLSSAKTHSMNFEKLVNDKKFGTVEEAIAYEFGYFIKYCKDQVIVNGDSELIIKQTGRTKAKIGEVYDKLLRRYGISDKGTLFEIGNVIYRFKFLLPKEISYSIMACEKAVESLGFEFDKSFKNFKMPPGRGSIFKGIKNTTLIDSSYNSNFSSASSVINSFGELNSDKKWLVIGDMLELGNSERQEHEKLTVEINKFNFEKIILMGPRVGKYTYPGIKNKNIVKFLGPKEALDYIVENIQGEEIILFKGARFMEGIIEHLLKNKEDIKDLARREKIWEIRRRNWGL